MTGVRFYSLQMLHLLWLVPVLAALFWHAARQRRRAAARFAAEGLWEQLTAAVIPARRRWRHAAVLAAVALIAVALTRPAWNPKPRQVKREGRDVVFVLDVSKSMLAEDLAPNRLERAKLAIRDCLELLEGDRVGLVVFAGNALVKCPLTLDYGFFRLMLEDVSVYSVARGGTMIGDALRTATTQIFDNVERQYKDLILITDGEDQESFPVQAAEAAGKQGIRLLAIGLGDETQGQRIPILNDQGQRSFLMHNGQEVWSKLDAATLREMALQTPGGAYLNVATGAFDLGAIYREFIATAAKMELQEETVTDYEEKFQIFLAPAILLLLLEALISDRRAASRLRLRMPRLSRAAAALVLLLAPAAARAESASSLVERGNRAYEEGNFDEAIAAYEAAAEAAPDSPVVAYNQGAAYYQKGDLEKAREAFRRAASSVQDPRIQALSEFNLGNVAYQSGIAQQESAPKDALKALNSSAQYFKNALRLDPEMGDAAHNLELARRKYVELKEILDQQPQDQQGEPEENEEEEGEREGQQDQQQQPDGQQEQQDGSEEQEQQQQDGGEQQESGQQEEQRQEAGEGEGDEQSRQPEEEEGESDAQQARQAEEQNEGEGEGEQAAPDETAQQILEQEQQLRKSRQMTRIEVRPVDKDW